MANNVSPALLIQTVLFTVSDFMYAQITVQVKKIRSFHLSHTYQYTQVGRLFLAGENNV